MAKVILNIGGMSCSACSAGLEKYLKKQLGIKNVTVNLVLAQAMIEYEESISVAKISDYIKEAGFKNLGVYDSRQMTEERQKNDGQFIFAAILAGLTLYISMAHMIYLPIIPFLNMHMYPLRYAITLGILSIAFIIYGFDILKSGYQNFVHRTPNMDTLVSIGVGASFTYSIFSTIMISNRQLSYVNHLYFESIVMVIFFIKLGRLIDLKSKEKTKEAIKELVQITPNYALLKTGKGEKKVTLDTIKKGDILIAKPGMKVAVDGIVVKGNGHFDESFITGEAIPVKKEVTCQVVAGSINYDCYIEYKAERIGKESTISEIVRLVVEATNTKAPISGIADKVCNYFVPFIIVSAILTLGGYLLLGYELERALNSFVSVLVIACPCALGLATPLAIVVSEGLCAKNGILVKSSEVLENAHKIDTVVFDKTGTLTYGNLKISQVYNYSQYSDSQLLAIVTSIEKKCSHPISKAFLQYAVENDLSFQEVKNFQNMAGIGLRGVIAQKDIYIGSDKLFTTLNLKNTKKKDESQLLEQGNSIVYVIENQQIIGLIGVSDVVRDSAREVVQLLQKKHKKVLMLTGDNEKVAQKISSNIGIEKVIANVMPKEKTEVVRRLMQDGGKVMMIGDGINDAPSLAMADIGVSISSGTDIATSSADVILMTNNLVRIVDLITISTKTITNIKQNLFWAFFYNICMIPIAIGLFHPFHFMMNPMVASCAMTISSIMVMINTLRLRKIQLEKRN